MNFIKKIINNKFRAAILIVVIVAVPFFSGCGSAANSSYLVNLEIWGTFDDSLSYTEIINQYKKINPYVGEIKFRKFSQDSYKQELLDALASGQGPDIFLINNSWLPSFKNKINPAPTPFVSEQDMKSNFPDVVSYDFVSDGKAYAVPLSMDSMVMYYNKDAFNALGIVAPPKTWQEFQEDVKKMVLLDSTGNITRSGAAIGTAQNINAFSDLMSLLMLQNGVELPVQKGSLAKLDQGVVAQNGSVIQAGEQALGFYTQFAKMTTTSNTVNPLYTWNSRQPNSIDAFAGGTTAMTFNYSWKNAEIKSKNPKLNYAIAPVPQIYPNSPIDMANYWGYAVSLNKTAPAVSAADTQTAAPVSNDVRMHEAWQFLRFLTLKNSGTVTLYNAVTKNSKDFPISFDPALDYLKKTNQPAARRDIIDQQKTDPFLGPIVAGNLIAKNWYKVNPDAIDIAFANMVESVVNNSGGTLHDALLLASNKINALSGGSGM